MSLQLIRLQRELTDAALRIADASTADDLFSQLAPVLTDALELRRIELRAESGYARSFGEQQYRLHGMHDMLRFPISIGGQHVGSMEVTTRGSIPSPLLSGTLRQVCALFAIVFARESAPKCMVQTEDWRELFDEHPAPLLVYELNSATILAANAAFCESYGYDCDELAGKRFAEVCVPDAEYNELLDPENSSEAVRCRHHRRDGTRLDVEVITRHCMWMGQPACMALINDVTTRTRIERRLVQSERRLERVQEIGGVGVFEIDLRTGQRYWSKELRRQFGVGDEQPSPQTCGIDLSIVHPDDRETVRKAYAHAIERREQCRVDHRIIQPGGTVVWLQLLADIDFDEYGEAVRCLGTTVDITDRKTAEQQLGFLAHYDPLTGLANRAHAIGHLQNVLRTERRSNALPALIYLDLDGFKTVNDTLGHDVGDRLLVEVGRRLKEATRDKDVVARMGGDEFVIVISSGNAEAAENVARRILKIFERPVNVGGREMLVTCSIGIAYSPGGGIDVEALLSRADMAMYQAKRTGRNRFCVYEDEMLRETVTRMELEADLRRAIEQQEFALVYQPIVSVSTRRLTGIEALIRWPRPDGMRMPTDFIALAEESDLIRPLGEWVLTAACRQAALWNLGEPLPISVNVSRRQLTDPNFVARVLAIVEETGVNPRALQLEITETALVCDIEKTHVALSELRSAGIRIAIDDFGTGYNSLANLRYCVIDTLKIDRSFIADIAKSPSDVAIASAVVSAGHNLGVRVVAEGVETEEHYKVLRRLGCDEAQGYWFSKPIPAAEFEARYAFEISVLGENACSA